MTYPQLHRRVCHPSVDSLHCVYSIPSETTEQLGQSYIHLGEGRLSDEDLMTRPMTSFYEELSITLMLSVTDAVMEMAMAVIIGGWSSTTDRGLHVVQASLLFLSILFPGDWGDRYVLPCLDSFSSCQLCLSPCLTTPD